jgi:hypothetical protein
MQAVQSNLSEHHKGLEYLNALLTIAKSEVARDGYISGGIAKKILFSFGLWDYLFAWNCLHAGPPKAEPEGSPSEKLVDKQSEHKHTDIMA